MPELPDITVYLDALRAHVVGQQLERVRLRSSFVLRSVEPPLDRLEHQIVARAERLGKRIVLAFPDDLFLVIHLMIAGRLRWRPSSPGRREQAPAPAALARRRREAGSMPAAERARAGMGPREHLEKTLPAIPVKIVLATFDFPDGALVLTEAGSTKRAWIRVVQGLTALAALDPGGLDPLDATPAAFHEALVRENHTLKRALTDPRLFSGIGNAYSDEILHAARLSPVKLTRRLTDEEALRLYDATRATLLVWIDHLRREAAGGFPEKVTAFHAAMAVHGRFKQPCPVCGAPVQRIVYAENECNYCARCQTGGKLLADRSLSRLLREDWPRSIPEAG